MSRLVGSGDFSIANAAGAAFRSDLNQVLQDIATNSAGDGAPSATRYAGQWMVDWAADTLNIRNEANDGDTETVINPSTGLVGLAGLYQIVQSTQANIYSAQGGAGWQTIPLTVNITPRDQYSRVLLMVQLYAGAEYGTTPGAWRLMRNTTHICVTTLGSFNATGVIPEVSDAAEGLYSISGIYLDSPGLDTSIAYSVEIRSAGTSGQYVRGNYHSDEGPTAGVSVIIAAEIAGAAT